jgi:hypothetical protein
VMHKGMRLPQGDDQFSITQKNKADDGTWMPHPLDAALRDAHGVEVGNGERRLRRIPVTIAFDNPSLSLSEQFAVFSRDGRPKCVGNGCSAKRRDDATGVVVEIPCPGPDGCEYGRENRCDALARLLVQIDGQETQGAYFILRTGSINAVTDLRTMLEMSSKLYGALAGLQCWLTLEPKSSSQSKGSTFWHASLRPRHPTLIETMKALKTIREAEREAGLNRQEFENVLGSLRGNGSFAEVQEDADQFEDLVVARFLDGDGENSVRIGMQPAAAGVANLADRLVQQAAAAGTATPAHAQSTAGAPQG